jgi:hypothetical protein
MKPQNIDLVLVVDSSSSMRPCFEALAANLGELIRPLEEARMNVEFGIVVHSATRQSEQVWYLHRFVCPEADLPYGPNAERKDYFSGKSDEVTRVLNDTIPEGDEHTLMALDVAIDLPYRPVASTHRVIAVFSDEKLENGVSGREPVAAIPDLIEKMMSRRIQLFVAAPESPALAELGSMDRAEIEAVDGGDGLTSVDFKKLLSQMGKSISFATLQAGAEPDWKKAIFGQDRFVKSDVETWAGE